MRWLFPLYVWFLLSSVAFGQSAALSGVVTDESGAIVPGATITLTNAAGVSNAVVGGNDGLYSFMGIAPGEYTAEASAPQLKTDASRCGATPTGPCSPARSQPTTSARAAPNALSHAILPI